MAVPANSRPLSMGTGVIETTPGRAVVHFGSPPGTAYTPSTPTTTIQPESEPTS